MLGMGAKKRGYTKSQNVIALCDIIEGYFACFEKKKTEIKKGPSIQSYV